MSARRLLLGAWPALAFAALAALMTWPQALRLGDRIAPGTDPLLQVWILAWDAHALLRSPLQIWSPPIFYPYADALAFTDNYLALALLAAPLIWAGASPLLAYNALVLLSFALAGLAVYQLVCEVLALDTPARRLAAFAAGASFAFCAFRMTHFVHLQLLQTAWLTWALLFARRLLAPGGGRMRDALLLALFAALQCVTALYYLPITALALGLYAALWAAMALWRRARAGEPLPWRRAALLALSCALAAAVVVPLTLPYARAYRTLGVARTPSEIDNWSAPLQAYLAADQSNRLAAALGGVFTARGGENALAPGLTLALLAIAGVALAGRDLWRPGAAAPVAAAKRATNRLDLCFWLALGLAALALSLGTGVRWERGDPALPIPTPYRLLYRFVPGLAALRVPARWGVLVALACSVLAAPALARVIHAASQAARPAARPRARLTALLAGAVPLLLIAERVSAPIPLVAPPDAAGIPAIYSWLAAPEQRDIQVVLELPVGKTPRGQELDRIVMRQLFQTVHWKALPVAFSGVIPFGTSELMARAQRLPDDETLRYLAMVGVDTLVLHQSEVEPARLRELVAGLDATALLRRRAVVGDALVYTLTAQASAPDPAPPSASVLISADERMPGPPVIGLLRRWGAAGHALYGAGRPRYYDQLASAGPAQPLDYGLLAADEDPLALGFEPAGLRWVSNGLALYARDPQLRASLALGRPVAGRFHPAYPARLDVTLAASQLRAADQAVSFDRPLAQPWLELDIASAAAQELVVGAGRVAVPPGVSTISLPAAGGATTIAGRPGATAILRLRVFDGRPAQPTHAEGLALAADTTFDGSLLRVTAQAGGAGELRLAVTGAAAADDRPVQLIEGAQPIPPNGGALSFQVDLLRPSGAWLTHTGQPRDGRYIVYLSQGGRTGAAGVPVAKFNIRGGAIADAEPVPLPLTAIR